MMRPAIVVVFLTLAACADTAPLRAVDTTDDGVSFEYQGDRAAEALRRAALYCANLGLVAVPRSTTRGADDTTIAAFDCS